MEKEHTDNKGKQVYGECTARIESAITELIDKFEREEATKKG